MTQPFTDGVPPGDFHTLPVDGDDQRKSKHAATGASAAGMRAITARAVAFYFRAPIKAFFRTRVDYLGFARAINPHALSSQSGFSWHLTTPGLIAYSVKTYGWSFIPNQILPPLLANVVINSVLFTSYLQVMGMIHEPASRGSKRVWPPPSFTQSFQAGFVAGSIQSVVAAPLDALQVRFRASDMLEGKYKNMWHYGAHKLQSIGLRGIFAGWSLSFLKDAFGSGLFFGTFDYIKSQLFYDFITAYYGRKYSILPPSLPGVDAGKAETITIRPHYAIEPTFLLMAGVSASIAQQSVLHPLGIVQNIHYNRLESLDHAATLEKRGVGVWHLYYHAYQETFEQCAAQASRTGGWRRFLFRDFLGTTIRQVPSTSAALIVFELVRRKYALDEDGPAQLERDGFQLLLA